MNKVSSYFTIAAISVSCSSAYGQNTTLSAMQFTEEDGISHELVLCMAQDKAGFIWFGARGGLGRFDGSKTILYYPSPGDTNTIPAETISSICITGDDKICAGTAAGGLVVLDQATQRFTLFQHEPSDSNSLAGNNVHGICERNGFLWAITEPSHLNRIELKTKKVHRIPLPHNLLPKGSSDIFHYTNCIIADPFMQTRLWITSQAGLWSYDIISNHWNLFLPFPGDNSNFYNRLSGLYMDNDSILWVGNSFYGLMSFNIFSQAWRTINTREPSWQKNSSIFSRAILPFDDEHLLFPQDGPTDSLYMIEKKSGNFKKIILNVSNKNEFTFTQPKTGIQDRAGNVWIGSYRTLTKITSGNDFFQSEYFKLPAGAVPKSNQQRCLLDSAGSNHFYLGTANGDGLLIVNKNDFSTEAVQYKSGFTSTVSDAPIHEMIFGADRIWLATTEGLLFYKNGNQRLEPLTWNNDTVIKTPLSSAFMDREGMLWLVTFSSGIIVLNSSTKEKKIIKHEPGNPNSLCSNNGIENIVRMADDEIWITTMTGISVYNETTKQFSNITQSFEGMPATGNPQLYDIEKDQSGNIWVSSTIYGMIKLEMKNSKPVRAKNLQVRTGFPTNQCGPIQKDRNGFLWIGTMKGIVRLDPVNETWMLFDKKDGLNFIPHGNGVLEQIDDGRILMSASNGMEWFHPDSLSPKFIAPQPYFISLLVNETPFAQDLILSAVSKVNLEHAQNDLQFEFGALNLSGNHDVKFLFQLENYDKRWIDNGSMQMVRYTNLSPGDYTFKVKAGNSYGTWSNETALISFSVLAPWWRTNWFISFSVIAVAFIIWLIYSYRLRQIKKMYAVRAKISSDLHDDIGSTLTSIRHYSEMAKQKTGNNIPGVTQILDKIGENAGDMIRSMSDIIWAVNPKYDDLITLRGRMENFAAEILSPKEILYAFIFDARSEQLKLPMEKRKNIFLIYKEALNNAAKYSGCKNVTIRFVHQSNLLILEIKDDGSGFDEQTVRRGNGLSNMSSRIQEMKGKIKIDSSPGKGTNIELEIPV